MKIWWKIGQGKNLKNVLDGKYKKFFKGSFILFKFKQIQEEDYIFL